MKVLPAKDKYIAEVSGWTFTVTISSDEIVVDPDMPEQLAVRLTTTGSMGGDSGHGGRAVIEFQDRGGVHTANVAPLYQSFLEASVDCHISTVRLTSSGDWELEGLVAVLRVLGDAIEKAGWTGRKVVSAPSPPEPEPEPEPAGEDRVRVVI